MRRRRFGREFKVEAVRLIRDRGVSIAQAARDLDVCENVLRKWVKEFAADPGQAFPGHGQMKPEHQRAPPRKARISAQATARSLHIGRRRLLAGCEKTVPQATRPLIFKQSNEYCST